MTIALLPNHRVIASDNLQVAGLEVVQAMVELGYHFLDTKEGSGLFAEILTFVKDGKIKTVKISVV